MLATCWIAVFAFNAICVDDAHGYNFFEAWPSNLDSEDEGCGRYNFFEAWPSADQGGGEERGGYNFFEAWPSNCPEDDPEAVIYRYMFFEAWPSKWKGWSLDGKGNDVLVEEIELAVEKIERAR